MLGREESVGVQARADFSKLREELSRTLSNDGAATTTDADETAPSPPPPPPPPQQTIVPKPILASQVRTRVTRHWFKATTEKLLSRGDENSNLLL